jgi:hypothetical protein
MKRIVVAVSRAVERLNVAASVEGPVSREAFIEHDA